MRLGILGFIVLSLFLAGCGQNSVNTSSDENNTNSARLAKIGTENFTAASTPREIKFESEGDLVIIGTLYESNIPNSPAVLMLHQWQSDRGSFREFALQLQEQGIGVLAIDGRGFGGSTQTSDGKTVVPERTGEAVALMEKDVGNAFLELAKQKNVDPERIGIVGASYGSSLAIIYAAANPKVKSVALLSPGLNYFGNMQIESAVNAYGERSLLMVAAEDDGDSARSVRKLQASSQNPKFESMIYERGGHGTDLFVAKVGLEKLLSEFLEESLN